MLRVGEPTTWDDQRPGRRHPQRDKGPAPQGHAQQHDHRRHLRQRRLRKGSKLLISENGAYLQSY